MHIHNTTFVCSQRELPSLLGLLRGELIPSLLRDGYAKSPRLARVASVMPDAQDAESISLQFEFHTTADYTTWKRSRLPELETKLTSEFGEKVLLFSTLLQVLPHD